MTAVTRISVTGSFWRPSAALRAADRLRPQHRLTATLVAAICAFTLILSAAPSASGLDWVGSETRVAAQTDAATAGIGFEAAANPVFVGGNGSYSYDGMSGCCVAPNSPSTFRGDARPPSEIFADGFQAVGDDLDLLRHAEGYPNSGYVSTSRSSAEAGGFPDGLPTNVYEVRAPGGIDVNDVLGPSSPYPWELEIAYPGRIPSSCIVGCTLPNGRWVSNPNFGPR